MADRPYQADVDPSTILLEARSRLRNACADYDAWRSRICPWLSESTSSEENCRTSWRVYQHKLTGAIVRGLVNCSRWTCPYCGVGRALRVLDSVVPSILVREGCFVGTIDVDGNGAEGRAILGRIKQRRIEQEASYMVVRRTLDREVAPRIFVFSDRNLAGRKQPRSLGFVEVPQALDQLISALTVPGIAPSGVSFGGSWELTRRTPGENRYRMLAVGRQGPIDRAMADLGLSYGEPAPPGRSHRELEDEFLRLMLRYRDQDAAR